MAYIEASISHIKALHTGAPGFLSILPLFSQQLQLSGTLYFVPQISKTRFYSALTTPNDQPSVCNSFTFKGLRCYVHVLLTYSFFRVFFDINEFIWQSDLEKSSRVFIY